MSLKEEFVNLDYKKMIEFIAISVRSAPYSWPAINGSEWLNVGLTKKPKWPTDTPTWPTRKKQNNWATTTAPWPKIPTPFVNKSQMTQAAVSEDILPANIFFNTLLISCVITVFILCAALFIFTKSNKTKRYNNVQNLEEQLVDDDELSIL